MGGACACAEAFHPVERDVHAELGLWDILPPRQPEGVKQKQKNAERQASAERE